VQQTVGPQATESAQAPVVPAVITAAAVVPCMSVQSCPDALTDTGNRDKTRLAARKLARAL